MKAADITPLGSLLLGVIALGATVALALQGKDIPNILAAFDTATIAVFLVAGAQRGTTPGGKG